VLVCVFDVVFFFFWGGGGGGECVIRALPNSKTFISIKHGDRALSLSGDVGINLTCPGPKVGG